MERNEVVFLSLLSAASGHLRYHTRSASWKYRCHDRGMKWTDSLADKAKEAIYI